MRPSSVAIGLVLLLTLTPLASPVNAQTHTPQVMVERPFADGIEAKPLRLAFEAECEGTYWLPPTEGSRLDLDLGLENGGISAPGSFFQSAAKRFFHEFPFYAWEVTCEITSYEIGAEVRGGYLRRGALEQIEGSQYVEIPGSACVYDGFTMGSCYAEKAEPHTAMSAGTVSSDLEPAKRPRSVKVCWEPGLRVVNRLQEPYTPLAPVFPEATAGFDGIYPYVEECKAITVEPWIGLEGEETS